MSIVHIAFYPSDWLAGTRGLSAEESGVYITLICRMYEMAAPIERDDDRLSRLCGCKSKPAFVRALNYLISEGKVTVGPEGLFNDRVRKEIEKVTEKSAKARDAAESRWSRKTNKNNTTSNADAMQTHPPSICQSEPESDKKKEPKGSSQKTPRKTAIASDAVITAGMLRAGQKRGHSDRETQAQFEKFKTSAIANGRKYASWEAAFVTWLDSEYFRPITKTTGDFGAFGKGEVVR